MCACVCTCMIREIKMIRFRESIDNDNLLFHDFSINSTWTSFLVKLRVYFCFALKHPLLSSEPWPQRRDLPRNFLSFSVLRVRCKNEIAICGFAIKVSLCHLRFQIFVALAVPLEDPLNSVSLSYFFEANYVLPPNITYLEPWALRKRRRRNIDRTTIYRVLESKFERQVRTAYSLAIGWRGRYSRRYSNHQSADIKSRDSATSYIMLAILIWWDQRTGGMNVKCES